MRRGYKDSPLHVQRYSCRADISSEAKITFFISIFLRLQGLYLNAAVRERFAAAYCELVRPAQSDGLPTTEPVETKRHHYRLK
jgi:hypothetical protein